MTTKYVADTVALVLRLESRRLPNSVKELFEAAEKRELEILIPAIVFAEIEISLSDVESYLEIHPSFIERPLDFGIIKRAFEIKDIRELHDRLISGSAMEHNIAIITNDPEIKNSKYVKTVWE